MKKILLFSLLIIACANIASAQWWFHEKTRFGFKAPDSTSDNYTRTFPVAEARTTTFNNTLNVEVNQAWTTITVTDTANANTILNVTKSAQVQVGSLLFIRLKSGHVARSITLGTGVKGATVTGTANKTQESIWMFNGTYFVYVSKALLD